MAPVLPRSGPLMIVKIGGSLAGSPQGLSDMVGDIQRASCRTVIVAGGGGFADAVRKGQSQLGFSDKLAHRLAMRAMEQFAEVLADLFPALVVCGQSYEIEAAHRSGRIPVWRPSSLMAGASGIPESWDVTSDSLAAFLAWELGAAGLILVKSVDGPDLAGAGQLSASGLVDAAFADFASRLSCPVRIVGPMSRCFLSDLLAQPDKRIGTSVTSLGTQH